MEAINEEKKSLKENDVWEVVENHILIAKPLHSKWIFGIIKFFHCKLHYAVLLLLYNIMNYLKYFYLFLVATLQSLVCKIGIL